MQKKALTIALLSASAGSLAAVGASVHPAQVARVVPAALQRVILPTELPREQPAPQQILQPSYAASPALSGTIAQWNALRQSDNLPFSSYASFLLAHRGWPGEAALRKTAEKAANSDTSSPRDIVAFFRTFAPTTPTGQARFAAALQATGQSGEAGEAARRAWTGGALTPADESRILTSFPGLFTPQDHDRRMEALLANGDRQSAMRTLPLASPARRAAFEAQIALQTNAPDAGSRLAMLPPGLEGDPGLLRDKANWLRGSGQANAARQLLAQRRPLSALPANPENWFGTMLTLAKEAANDGQWTAAYDIASKLDDAYAPGTDVSLQPFGERDDYTSLAWLAGSSAFHKLGRPADAVRMFDRYARAARSQQTRSKGFYWAARAAHAAGQPGQSNSYLEQAAAATDQFYGQLALERLGRRVTPPSSVAPTMPSPADRAAFESRSLVQAARALGQMGRWTDQTLFVRAIAQQVDSDTERQLAADFGRSIGRPDLGVWVAREARNKGATFYARGGFPEVPTAPVFSRYRTIAHAITRQESSFDRAAMSPVGARGMMQLMPGTAREVSGKLGVGYDLSRLTTDPSYNMMLGTSYFSTLLDQWGGSMPLAVASYNAGAGNVRRWVRENGDPRTPGVDMVKWIEDIPFSETRNYVQRVLENAVVYDSFGEGGGYGTNRLSTYLGKTGPG
jgi:soluble lytic murein transglycosylase